ncbi:ectoine/hydroxyectoine ABC transporter permease subunit EhuD [Pseudonocardiaceae bacterium YIM PH 21723]|nr:ectoine/hydroxyectoine ABC transporter permease subunit EhuD [Pseudonocardiaceae bacterium YIM PH 21723]
MNFDWNVAWHSVPALLDGLLTALLSIAIGYPLAIALGLLLVFPQRSARPWIRIPVRVVVEFIRSTPLLVQLFFLFYVLPAFGVELSAFATGAIGLGLHYATYTSEVFRAGIESVPTGQWDAATALNLSTTRTWWSVVLPQAIPKVLPPLGNYAIAMFKDTPQLTAITVLEVLSAARAEGAQTFRYLEAITMAGLLYLLVSLVLAWLARRVEQRYATTRGIA